MSADYNYGNNMALINIKERAMESKYKLLIKKGIISIFIGAAAAAVVCAVFNLYIGGFELTAIQADNASKMRLTFMIMFFVTGVLAAMSAQLGIEERRLDKKWREQNRNMAKDFNSDIKGVNIAGLIDDSQGKEFSTIFGERVKVGEDHGTAYMIFKTLLIFSLFMTVSVSIVMILMLLSLT